MKGCVAIRVTRIDVRATIQQQLQDVTTHVRALEQDGLSTIVTRVDVHALVQYKLNEIPAWFVSNGMEQQCLPILITCKRIRPSLQQQANKCDVSNSSHGEERRNTSLGASIDVCPAI
eukprot:m.91438 g.91438  ORF g.91438 m.91438 type:complete len:118 (-) comp8492_c0_seq3:880-1233(-)